MKLKLDENVPLAALQILVASGHDVHTVPLRAPSTAMFFQRLGKRADVW